jgi:hypothetical protein
MGKGALARHRERKREQAEQRSKASKEGNRRYVRQLAELSPEQCRAIAAAEGKCPKVARRFGVSPVVVEKLRAARSAETEDAA